MKVLQINASYKPAYIYGGPTISVSKLSEQLIKAGFTVDVFATTANGHTELDVPLNKPVMVGGVPVYYFKRITKDHSHFSPTLLLAVWKKAKSYDVVHIHAWWNLVSLFSCLIVIVRGTKVVVAPRGTLSAYSFRNKTIVVKKMVHYLLGRPLLNKCAVHLTSLHEQEAIERLIAPKKTFVLPNFITLPIQCPLNKHEPGDVLKILFLSRIEEKKGLELLLNALMQVTVPYHLTIAGDGDSNYIDGLKLLAQNNGVHGCINWAGFQNEGKFQLMADSDLLVLPSYDENFGNVVVESLCVGTAVLISNQVGLASYVAENGLGWICETNPPSITEILNTLDKARLADIKRRAPGIIRSDFQENILVNKYIDMYKQIIA